MQIAPVPASRCISITLIYFKTNTSSEGQWTTTTQISMMATVIMGLPYRISGGQPGDNTEFFLL